MNEIIELTSLEVVKELFSPMKSPVLVPCFPNTNSLRICLQLLAVHLGYGSTYQVFGKHLNWWVAVLAI